MENEVKRYNEYCLLLSQLQAKKNELVDIINKKGGIEYQIGTLEKQLSAYKDISTLPKTSIDVIKRLRIAQCLQTPVYYREGGSITTSPTIEYRKDEEGFKSLTSEQKKLYRHIENILIERQYSLQNAIMLASEDDVIDAHENVIIENYVNETMREMENYDDLPVSDLEKIKQIIYNFIEHISKNQ
ncbi:MAG: hypothetical protein KDD29_10505 [Flavobacteriales bacterium]|nr:hypothetical protein [Flavobacteriales bacterium]